jgi:hypothetical protein
VPPASPPHETGAELTVEPTSTPGAAVPSTLAPSTTQDAPMTTTHDTTRDAPPPQPSTATSTYPESTTPLQPRPPTPPISTGPPTQARPTPPPTPSGTIVEYAPIAPERRWGLKATSMVQDPNATSSSMANDHVQSSLEAMNQTPMPAQSRSVAALVAAESGMSSAYQEQLDEAKTAREAKTRVRLRTERLLREAMNQTGCSKWYWRAPQAGKNGPERFSSTLTWRRRPGETSPLISLGYTWDIFIPIGFLTFRMTTPYAATCWSSATPETPTHFLDGISPRNNCCSCVIQTAQTSILGVYRTWRRSTGTERPIPLGL